MNRNHASASGSQAGEVVWRRALRAFLAWSAVGILFGLVWMGYGWTFAGPNQVLKRFILIFSLGVAHILLAIVLERGLTATSIGRVWRYRLAFLIDAAIPFLYAFIHLLVGSYTGLLGFVWLVLVAFAGAYLGGLAATGLNDGLWEDNSPPAVEIQQDVRRLHVQVMGQLPPVPWGKRGFDLIVSGLCLVISLPVWVIGAFLIWFEDPGPLLFVKNSVSKGGRNFHQFKFRTMICGAEEHTGPVLSQQDDQRVLRIGRILRKTALDELPQLVNILRGDMSFVGPRPQRTVLVHAYLQSMPEYAWRHAVLPGLAGLAQVAGDYYLTPRQKLRFDRLYIRYSGLGFDLKLAFLAFMLTFWFRWQRDWDGRLPRAFLRFGGPGGS